MEKRNKASLYGIIAYIMWGVLPFYWKILQDIDSKEVLAYRIVFSSIIIFFALVISRKFGETSKEIIEIVRDKKKFMYMALGALFISLN